MSTEKDHASLGNTASGDSQRPPSTPSGKSAIEQLAEILDEAGAKVQFGLRAQGKFDTVGRMLREGATDREIGRAIGWDGATAVRFYALESALFQAAPRGEE